MHRAPDEGSSLVASYGAANWTVARPRDESRQRCKRLAEHVLYEIEACSAASSLVAADGRSSWRDFPPRSKEWWAGNVYLESFLVHLRSLDEFFYKDLIEATKAEPPLSHVELHRSDVTALSFVREQQEWLTARPARPSQLQRSYKRINRTIQHLSWQRLSSSWDEDHNPFVKSQDWSVWSVWDALKPTIRAFLDHAEDAVLSEGFRYHAERALRDEAIV